MELSERVQLVKLVKKEGKKLKKNATKRELSKLDINSFDGNRGDECIYGQMTGDCESKRAIRLIVTCAAKVYETDDPVDEIILNGKPTIKTRSDYWSPIEVFGFVEENNNDHTNIEVLIKYLKGEIKELVIE